MKSTLAILIIIITFFSCSQKEVIKKINVAAFTSLDCFTPDDAIIKFNTLNENTFGQEITDFLKAKEIAISTTQEAEINTWVKETMFNLLPSPRRIIEWNLFDDDFCMHKKYNIIEAKTDSVIHSSTIKICNSVLNEDSVIGNYWRLFSDDWKIEILACNKIKNTIGYVDYYQVVKNYPDKNALSLATDKQKHQVLSTILISYENKSASIYLRDTLKQDVALLYSGMLNIQDSDYLEE